MTHRTPTTDPLAQAAVQAVTDLRGLAADAWAGPDPKRGLFASDLIAVEPLGEPTRSVRGKLLLLSANGVLACWASVQDTLMALEADLRRRPHAIWSSMTLARSLQEAVIFIRYVADPTLTVEQRLTRIANMWLEEKTNMVNAAPNITELGTVNPRASAIAERDFAVSELRSGGFNVQTKATGVPTSVKLGGTVIGKIGFNTASEALALMPPDAPEAWRLASGAAHARPWYLTGNAVEDPPGKWSAWAFATMTPVSIVGFAIENCLQTLGEYFDTDTSDTRRQINQLHKGFLAAASTGAAVLGPAPGDGGGDGPEPGASDS